MCAYGDTLPVRVWIDPRLSHTGKGYWKMAQIDRCIAPAVRMLQERGVNMLASCCGHGKAPSRIDLSILEIFNERELEHD